MWGKKEEKSALKITRTTQRRQDNNKDNLTMLRIVDSCLK
jgi:ribosomal protein S20